ncbi:MAG: M23 family metallopeptidase [Pseudomonadota bacterium]
MLAALGLVGFTSLMLILGYNAGVRTAENITTEKVQALHTIELRDWFENQWGQVHQTARDAEDNLDALAMRLARLQAGMMRVDALGQHLVKLSDLDSREFDFDEPPAMGGPDSDATAQTASASSLVAGIDALEHLLVQRRDQLTFLEEWLMTNQLKKEVFPSGVPVEEGWVSSGYGWRIHPITGKEHLHGGVDFPGDRGDEILAVAAGVVTRSERDGAYGNLVEIRHADGISTRYAHNNANLVKKGDMVDKGQVIALLGSSGRSTGPHVHFEVRKDGKTLNPKKYIKAQS